MNLVRITKVINALANSNDADLIPLYKRKREELVIEINKDVVKTGLPAMTLHQLLLLSPEPELAATI